jgi:hypothetical protein
MRSKAPTTKQTTKVALRRPAAQPIAQTSVAGRQLAGLAIGPVQRIGGSVAAEGGNTIQAQVGRLSDPHLQSVQRQALVAQIGRVQGNRHLQQMMAACEGGKRTVSQCSLSR